MTNLLTLSAVLALTASPKADVQNFVKEYAEATNKGEVTALVEMYSRKGDVTSASEGDIARGWEAIRKDKETLVGQEGSFKFSLGVVDVVPLGASHAVAYASGTLTVAVAEQVPKGRRTVLQRRVGQVPVAFTFVLEKSAQGWKIIHDHTSVGSPKTQGE